MSEILYLVIYEIDYECYEVRGVFDKDSLEIFFKVMYEKLVEFHKERGKPITESFESFKKSTYVITELKKNEIIPREGIF